LLTRRQAILALPLACGALAVRAQMPKSGPTKKRIALIYGGSQSEAADLEKPIWTTMQRLGWIRDENLFVERAFADGDPRVLKHLAETLASKHVDLILALGDRASLAGCARYSNDSDRIREHFVAA
jgi:hypothetical protein